MSHRHATVARQMLEAINFLLAVASKEKMPLVVARLIEVKLELEAIANSNDRKTETEPSNRKSSVKELSGPSLKRRPDAA
jgi:hypothetical protein